MSDLSPLSKSPLAVPKTEEIHLPMTQPPIMFNIGTSNDSVVNAVQPAGGRRGRGRPRGSKNKPKVEKDSVVLPIALEVPPGVDIIQWVVHYACSRKTCINILGGHGFISHATLSHVGSHSAHKMFTERLSLMSFSGAYVLSRLAQGPAYFVAAFVRENGCIVGGAPLRMISEGPVVLTAIMYKNLDVLNVKVKAQPQA